MSKNIVRSGFFDSFTIFRIAKVNNDMKYLRILKKLIKSNLIISAEKKDEKEGTIVFNEKFEKYIEKRLEMYRNTKEEGKMQPAEIRNDFIRMRDKPTATITPMKNKISINVQNDVIDNLIASQEMELERLAALYNYEKMYTGFHSHDFKNVFLLYPSKAYIGEKVIYISFFLMIYKNGLAILNSKINIDGHDIDDLSEKVYNVSLDKVFLPEFLFSDSKSDKYKKRGRCNSLRDVEDVYKHYLGNIFNANSFSIPFNYLTMIDYNSRPEKFAEKSNLFNGNIYKLLCAPINEFNKKSNETIQEFMNKKYFETSYFHRYYANDSRLISVYTKRINGEFNFNKTDENNVIMKDLDVYILSLTGVINVIEAIVFRKFINDNYVLYNLNTETTMNRLLKLKLHSKNDSLLDLKRYYYSYGSLTTLQEFMYDKCSDYTKTEIAEQWSAGIEELIKLKKQQSVSTLSILGPIVTIMLTLIFSFPAIEQVTNEFDTSQDPTTVYIIFNAFFILIFVILFTQLSQTEIGR